VVAVIGTEFKGSSGFTEIEFDSDAPTGCVAWVTGEVTNLTASTKRSALEWEGGDGLARG